MHASTYVGAGDRKRTSRTYHKDEVAAAEAYDEKVRRSMGHPLFPASSAFLNRNVTYRQYYLLMLNFPTIAEIKELLRGGHVHAQEQRERDAAAAANEHARRFAPTRVTNRDHTNLRVSRDSMKVIPVILHRSWYWFFRKPKNLTGKYSMYDRTRLCALHNAQAGTEAPPVWVRMSAQQPPRHRRAKRLSTAGPVFTGPDVVARLCHRNAMGAHY